MWFSDKETFNELFKKIPGDFLCCTFLVCASKSGDPTELKDTLDKMLEVTPPVIIDTYEYIECSLKEYDGDLSDTLQVLKQLRHEAIDNASSIRKEFSSYSLASNWYIQSEGKWAD